MITNEKMRIGGTEYNNSSYREINGLRGMVSKAKNENKKIFQEILIQDSSFVFDLYGPKEYAGENSIFLKEILMKQIDRLMEQKYILVRKKEAMQFISADVLGRKEVEYEKNINHYSYLRSAWTKMPKQETDLAEKIDSLSKVVNMVRNNIKKITKQENNIIEEEAWNFQREISAKELKFHQKNREKIERVLMEIEELKTRYL